MAQSCPRNVLLPFGLEKHLPLSTASGKSGEIKTVATKHHLYEVLVVSVFIYEAECWTLKREDERSILAAEINWLRRLSGISKLKKK